MKSEKPNAIKAIGAFFGIGAVIAPWIVLPFIGKEEGTNPFSRNEKHYKNIITRFDNKGNYSVEEVYKKSRESSIVTIDYYSKWEKNDEGIYQRTKKTYNWPKDPKIDIKKEIQKETINIEDFFGSPKSVEQEYKNDITYEEYIKEPFIQGVYYDIDKNDYKIYRQTVKEEMIDIISYLGQALLISTMEVPFLALVDKGYEDIEKIITNKSNNKRLIKR